MSTPKKKPTPKPKTEVTDSLFAPLSTEPQLTAKELHQLQLLEEIYSKNDIEMKTDLTVDLVKSLTKGQLFAERYGSKLMKNLTDRLMYLLVSKGRQGRKEFIEMSKSFNSVEDVAPTLSERLLGGR